MENPHSSAGGDRLLDAERTCPACASGMPSLSAAAAADSEPTLLYARWAAEGSGSAELDRRAAAVLEQLRADARLERLRIVPERVIWLPHDVAVVFSDREAPTVFAKEKLVALSAEPLADTLVTCATLGAGAGELGASY